MMDLIAGMMGLPDLFGEVLPSYSEMTDEELECDTVAGHLTADDVFGRIKKHWEEKGGKDGNV